MIIYSHIPTCDITILLLSHVQSHYPVCTHIKVIVLVLEATDEPVAQCFARKYSVSLREHPRLCAIEGSYVVEQSTAQQHRQLLLPEWNLERNSTDLQRIFVLRQCERLVGDGQSRGSYSRKKASNE